MSTGSDFHGIFGATLVGCFVACILYGITVLQAFCYFTFYPNDSVKTKLLVLTIWLLDSLHTAIISYSTYHFLINNFFQVSRLELLHWSIPLSILINTVISCTVQIYFTIRIGYLTSQKLRLWILLIIGAVIFAHFAFAIETVTLMFIKKEWAKSPGIILRAATPFAIFAVLSDLLIAASLILFLHGHKSGMRRTDRVITKLILYAANRGLLTSTVIIIEVITFTRFRHTLWFLAIDFALGKLYANSLLATLNSRNFVGKTEIADTSLRFSSLHLGDDDDADIEKMDIISTDTQKPHPT